MSTTNFVANVTPIAASWLNDVNTAAYVETVSAFRYLNTAEISDVLARTRTVDVYTKVQAAIDSGKSIYFPDGDYRCDSKLLFNQANKVYFGRNALIVFNGTTTSRIADVTANDVTFDQLEFNGNNKQPRSCLVFVQANVKRPTFRNVRFKDILGTATGTNALNATYGLAISPYSVEDFKIQGSRFSNIKKYNDGTYTAVAVGLGFVGGICFLDEDMGAPVLAQSIPTRGLVQGCVFDTIQTILAGGLTAAQVALYDDADAIRTYSQPGGATRLEVMVTDCDFYNISKRAYKLLASGADVQNCRIYGTGLTYAMVNPINLAHGTRIRNVSIIANSSLPVQTAIQWTVSGDATNTESLVDGVSVTHCVTGISLFSDASNSPIRNLKFKNILMGNVTTYGIVQGSPVPTTQSNVSFENIDIVGSGTALAGIDLPGAADGLGGYSFKNVRVENGSVNIGSRDVHVDGIEQIITSTSFVGPSTSARLFRIGDNGVNGSTNVTNVFVNAYNLNTSFLNATRTEGILFFADNANYENIRIKVPTTLTETYKHFEFCGNDWALDGLTYDGPGMGFIGQLVGSVRWCVKNARRLGSGASATTFLYTNNASTGNGLFENITDFRPTTASSITINNGLGVGNRFVVYNVASKTSNATIVQHGGLATVVNQNAF